MNYKKILHTLLCTITVLSLFSCSENTPDNPEGGGESKSFFIKHPWEGGSWEWRQMSSSGNNTYTYSGVWGGVGANINTSADDNDDSEWYPASSISGASSVSTGDYVTFTFVSSNGAKGTLSVVSNGGGGGQSSISFYIKHPWSSGSWEWRQMSSIGNNTYTCSGVWGGVGANINTTADDNDNSKWYEANVISGASSVGTGDNVTFTFVSYNGVNGSLSVSKNGGGGGTTTKPNTPSNVTANAGSSSIVVSWNAVSGADSYNVYRSTSVYDTPSLCTTVSNTTYTDNNVTAGTTYYYRVTAQNNEGESDYSDIASATISSGGGGDNDQAPSAPSNLTAHQGGTKAVPCVVLNWTGSEGAEYYEIYRGTSSSSITTKLNTTYSTSYEDYNNISNGKKYYYKVRAVGSNGKTSGYSNVESCSIEIVWEPAPPKITKAKASNNYATLQLDWDYPVTANLYSAPTEVMLETEKMTTNGYYIFDWTTASSKKTIKINVSDFAANNISYDYTLFLKVKNSEGNAVTEIIWSPSKHQVYIGGTQKESKDL